MKFAKAICVMTAALLLTLLLPLQGLAANLTQGTTGEDVKNVQQILKDNSYYNGAVDGIFSSGTLDAVKAFQAANGLTVDGIVGTNTSSKLNAIAAKPATITGDSVNIRAGAGTSTAIIAMVNKGTTVYVISTLPDWYKVRLTSGIVGYAYKQYVSIGSTSSMVTLKIGMSGSDVVAMQTKLKALQYFNSDCTGYFGAITLEAVKAFQSVNGLNADGIAGPMTLSKLYGGAALPKPAPSAPAISGASVVAYAETFLGRPYVYGGNGPDSFDCSGFTGYVYNHFGYTLPDSAYSQGYGNYGTKITNISDLQVGDLVFFDTVADSDASDHSGIYMGNNQFINALNSSKGVVITDMSTSYWTIRFSWGIRVLR